VIWNALYRESPEATASSRDQVASQNPSSAGQEIGIGLRKPRCEGQELSVKDVNGKKWSTAKVAKPTST